MRKNSLFHQFKLEKKQKKKKARKVPSKPKNTFRFEFKITKKDKRVFKKFMKTKEKIPEVRKRKRKSEDFRVEADNQKELVHNLSRYRLFAPFNKIYESDNANIYYCAENHKNQLYNDEFNQEDS